MAAIEPERWQRLSPLLDDWLDLPTAQRTPWLEGLRQRAPDLADELAPLLAEHAALEDSGFMQSIDLPDEPLLQPGQLVGAYTLVRLLGRGGMGQVWLGRRHDGRFEGVAAIKLLGDHLPGGATAAARFAREGQILARLTHPHIARLLDAGHTQASPPQPYLVLEYVDGEPITGHCQREALGVEARVRLFLDVLAAVAHAHNRLILHRDLKPGNILVERDSGAVKLLDFGIAKLLSDAADAAGEATELTRQAGRAYTVRYAAPEQLQGSDVTTATDVYALGVLLYQLLSGSHPTGSGGRTTRAAVDEMREVIERQPPRLSEQARRSREAPLRRDAGLLRGDLDTIVAQALKKKPAERYANAEALAQDLRRWLAHQPISARPDARLYVWGRFVRRHRAGLAAAAAAVLAIGAGSGLALWKAHEAQAQRAEAEGLLEFMLGDLRRRLDPVGRLDVLDAVGERALAYYARQDPRGTDADGLGRRARALHLIGEIAEKRGRHAEASQRFAEAARSTAEQLARDPGNPQRLFDHAQSEYWLGHAAWQQRQWTTAESAFQRYQALAEQLVAQAPAVPEWQAELGYAHHNLGVLALGQGHAPAARQRLHQALQIWDALVAAHPAWQVDRANTLGWLAQAEEDLGQFEAAMASNLARRQALQPVAGQPQDHAAGMRLAAVGDAAQGRLLLNLGHTAQAVDSARRARDAFTELATLDPDNLEVLGTRGFMRLQLAEAWQAHGQTADARAERAALAADLARLLRADPGNPAWRHNLQARLLSAQLAAADSPAAAAAPRQALARLLAEAPAGRPAQDLDTDTRWALALAALRLGERETLDGHAEPRARWLAARAWLAPLADSADPRVLCLRAWLHWRLGEGAAAQALLARLAAGSYRHPLYAELRQRLGTPHPPEEEHPA